MKITKIVGLIALIGLRVKSILPFFLNSSSERRYAFGSSIPRYSQARRRIEYRRAITDSSAASVGNNLPSTRAHRLNARVTTAL